MDIFNFFRTCFLCKCKHNKQVDEPLLCVEHPGYASTYHYFHRTCLQTVLQNPEEHIKFLDEAIQISDQEAREERRHLGQLERYRSQIRRANEITQIQDSNEDVVKQQHITTQLIDEKEQNLDIIQYEKKKKFKTIFGDNK